MDITIMSSNRVNPRDELANVTIKLYCHAILTICMIAQNIAIANQSTKTHARRRATGSIYFTIFESAKSTSLLYWVAIFAVILHIVDVRSALSIICMISGVKNIWSLSLSSIERDILLPHAMSSDMLWKSFLMILFPELAPVRRSVFTILTHAVFKR